MFMTRKKLQFVGLYRVLTLFILCIEHLFVYLQAGVESSDILQLLK